MRKEVPNTWVHGVGEDTFSPEKYKPDGTAELVKTLAFEFRGQHASWHDRDVGVVLDGMIRMQEIRAVLLTRRKDIVERELRFYGLPLTVVYAKQNPAFTKLFSLNESPSLMIP